MVVNNYSFMRLFAVLNRSDLRKITQVIWKHG